MAHAQRLTAQVRSMTARIQELEKALAQTPTQTVGEQPPLPHGCTPKSLEDPDVLWDPTLQEVSNAIGSLSIGLDGQAKFHGASAGSEYFQELTSLDDDPQQYDPRYLGFSFELVDLINAFPFGLKDCPYTKHLFIPFLPPQERTMELIDIYYKNAAWMFDPITAKDVMENIVHPIYGTTGEAHIDALHPHRLSVFFILLATGVLYENHSPSLVLAEQYHALARAALSLESIVTEATCAAVQALFMMIWYIYSSDRTNNETRWVLAGVCCRIAQTIGLQRDSASWNLPPEEMQRRRIMFWELYTYDTWSSIVNGRPPALSLQHTDCRFPDDLNPFISSSGGTDWGWHAWKFRYSACCLSLSVHHIFNTKVPPYSAILELDKKIRKFPLPSHLQSPNPSSAVDRAWSMDPPHAMQQFCVVCERESNLLYIHRSYFAQAIREDSTNPLRHKYAPSVLAVSRSASRLITSLRGLYSVHPVQASRNWFFWSGVFSSCIVLGALVVESPGCTLAANALKELECALPFYNEGSSPCRPPATLTMLQNLWKRAYSTFTSFRGGIVNPNAQQVSRPGSVDELDLLGARNNVINNKSQSNTPSSKGGSPLRRETMVEYYDNIDRPGFDQGRDYEMSDTGAWFIGSGGFGPYPSQSGASESNQSILLTDRAMSAPAPISVPSLTLPSGSHHEARVAGLGYPAHPGLDYLQSQQQQHQHTLQEPNVAHPGVVEAHQAYPLQQHASFPPLPDSNMLGLTAGHELNQEEVWRNFIHQLGI